MTYTEDPSLDYRTVVDAVRMGLEAGMSSPFMLYAHPETLPVGWTQGSSYDVFVDGVAHSVAVADDLSKRVVPSLGEAR